MLGTEPTPAAARSLVALRPALTLALILTLARLIYLRFMCPYDLVEDEAFYWLWAQHPAWSYHTKGPGIAWSIWLSTHVLGDTMLGVRLVAVLAGLVASGAVAALAHDTARLLRPDAPGVPAHAAMLGVGLYNLAPFFQGASLIATIDGPYVACWSLACWGALRVMLLRGPTTTWALLGAALGVGFLMKYTILLLIPGLVLFAWLNRARLNTDARWRRGLVVCAGVFALSLIPVLVWNAQHDWPTIKHLLGRLRLGVSDQSVPVARESWGYSPWWTLEMLAGQLGLIGPGLVLATIAAWTTRRETGPGAAARSLLVCCAGPLLAFYFLTTFVVRIELNWPVAASVTLLALGASVLAIGPRAGWREHAWRTTLIFGLVTGLGMLRVDLLRDALSPLAPGIARLIPVGRIMGAAELASQIRERVGALRERTGLEPFVVTSTYGRAAIVSFYTPGHPAIYCASSRTGGRVVQQDYWPDTDLDDPALRGRPALAIGHNAAQWRVAFERVEDLGPLPGEVKKDLSCFAALGFQGFPAPSPAR